MENCMKYISLPLFPNLFTPRPSSSSKKILMRLATTGEMFDKIEQHQNLLKIRLPMLRNLSFKDLCSYVFISSTKYCRTIKKYAQD